MPGIIPGRADLKYLLSFFYKCTHIDWLHAHIFGTESIVTIAVEETKMQQTGFVASVLFWFMLLGVSPVKETQSHQGGADGSFGYLGNVCF